MKDNQTNQNELLYRRVDPSLLGKRLKSLFVIWAIFGLIPITIDTISIMIPGVLRLPALPVAIMNLTFVLGFSVLCIVAVVRSRGKTK